MVRQQTTLNNTKLPQEPKIRRKRKRTVYKFEELRPEDKLFLFLKKSSKNLFIVSSYVYNLQF